MTEQRLFMDTHDAANETFPSGLDQAGLDAFMEKYLDACRAEGVELKQVSAGLPDGRAFCLSAAPDADAVRRAHERVGLPFDSIVEVTLADLR